MATRSTTSKPSTPGCCSQRRAAGFSLIEMLVAMVVTSAVMAGALTLALSSRRMYEVDEARTGLNQSLRASKDFVVADVRQAGERLGATFPILELVRGEDLPGGQPGDPDELTVRRNLVDTILRSCRDVSGTHRRIYLAELVDPPPPGCVPVPDGNSDGWPDNHGVWNQYRIANGVDIGGNPAVPAFIFNPTNGVGEFFWYWADDADDGYIETPVGQTWANDYPEGDECQVYLLEERRYLLNGNVLQLVVNRDDVNPLNLVDGISDFQLRALFRIPPPPAPPVEPPPQESFGFGDAWDELRAVEVTVRGRVPFKDRFIEREWSAQIMPRNVLSR